MRTSMLYLKDVLKAIEAIEEFVKHIDFEAFKNDDMRSSAVIRKFEIIGEATKNIHEDIKQKYPSIPWKNIAGMRDRLIHFYHGIKYELVWDTITIDLPGFKLQIKEVLEDLQKEQG